MPELRIVHLLGPSDGGIRGYVRLLADAQRRAGHEVAVVERTSATRGFTGLFYSVAEAGDGAGPPDSPPPLRAVALGLAHRTRLRRRPGPPNVWLGRREPLPWTVWMRSGDRRDSVGYLGGTGRSRELVRILAGVDIVHAHGLKAGAMAVLAARAAGPYRAGRRPAVVVTLHNLPIGSTRVRFAGAALARIVGRAEAVLAVSDDIIAWLSARRLRAGRPARAAARAPAEWTPVPAPDLGLPQRTAASVKGELGLAPSDRLILTVARLAPQKGLDLAVATAQAIAEASPTWPFLWVIAGEGPARGRLEALIAATGVPVRLLGRRDDLPDLYHAADLVVGTSHWEGQPLALQEALKAGAPIVATGRGGVGALIGRGGKLVARNRLVLRDAIVQLLDDPESLADLRKQAKLRGRELSRAADALAAVTAVYSRVLGGDC